jgi:predicted nuclease of predicted toxin-antitoxin system
VRFLADECCDAGLVTDLRGDGYDVLYAKESLRGAVDDVILAVAESQDRILLTEDKDFGELVFRLRRSTRGIILLRFEVSERHLKSARLCSLAAELGEELPGKFVVLDAHKVRMRSL